MNRFLQYFNFAGILALAVLCAFQWHANRTANLEVIRLEKIGLQQASNLAEKEKTLKGSISDLDSFRQQLAQAHAELKDLEPKLATATHENLQLISEREALKKSLTNWVGAVSARDERLRSATLKIENLSTDRNRTVSKFNELAEKYNSVAKELSEARAQLSSTNKVDIKR
jgi:regulator of replication initiation timing